MPGARLCMVSLALVGVNAFPPPICGDLSGQWIIQNSSQTSTIGEYADIVQTGCQIAATNPVEMWSPAPGDIDRTKVRMFGLTGKLVENQIFWDDGLDTVWRKATALPLEEGLALVRSMLQHAVTIEHSLIQPYLAALYSIEPGTNANASSVLHEVVVEEMLHMTAVSNLLNAVGGHPRLNESDFTPTYPVMVPFCNMSVNLAPFSHDQMNTFRLVEEASWGVDWDGKINTVGVYYFRIGVHLELLVHQYGEAAVFVGDPSLQVNSSSSRGYIRGIYNLSDAVHQLSGVYMQGEGAQGSLYETSPWTHKEELAHFYRFNEVVHDKCYARADNTTHPSPNWDYPTGDALGVNYSMVRKFKANLRMHDYLDYADVYQKMVKFNACYTQILADLHVVFNGSPGRLSDSVSSMASLTSMARELNAIADPKHPGFFMSPSFEWVNTSDPNTPSCVSSTMHNGMLHNDVVFA